MEYDAILGQWEPINFYNRLSNYTNNFFITDMEFPRDGGSTVKPPGMEILGGVRVKLEKKDLCGGEGGGVDIF